MYGHVFLGHAVLINTARNGELQVQLSRYVGKISRKVKSYQSVLFSLCSNQLLPLEQIVALHRTLLRRDIRAWTGIPSLHFLLARHLGYYPIYWLSLDCPRKTKNSYLFKKSRYCCWTPWLAIVCDVERNTTRDVIGSNSLRWRSWFFFFFLFILISRRRLFFVKRTTKCKIW